MLGRFRQHITTQFSRYGQQANMVDVLKCAAVVMMLVDHIGMYLFPDALWLRALGRFSFPIFLFLIGYSGQFRFSRALLLAAIALLLLDAVLHYPIFPLDILFTILFARMVMGLPFVQARIEGRLFELFLILAVLFFPLYPFIDYSTTGVMFAVMGAAARRKIPQADQLWFMGCCFVFHAATQQYGFHFGIAEASLAALVLCLSAMALYYRDALPLNRCNALAPLRTGILLCSRFSLEFYVLHIAIIQITAYALSMPYFGEHLRFW